MSIALMSLAWKSSFHAGKKMVLLALCDNANDQGECFPSVSMLAEKCSMSERSVFNHIAELERDGAIQRSNRTGRSTIYGINPCKFCTPTPATVAEVRPLTPADSAEVQALTPATVAPPPLQPLHPTPANSAPTPATVAPITIKEPNTDTNTNTAPEGVEVQVWQDFQKLRAKQRAPITATVIKGIQREASKAGISLEDALAMCCERSWRGFKADWVATKPQAKASLAESAYTRQQREKWETLTGRTTQQHHEFLEITQ